MSSLRRRLRLWATAGLIWQAISLSALVPRACCAAHEPPVNAATEAEPTCHTHAAEAAQPTPDVCSLRSGCDGPIGVLSALLAHHGVLPDPSTVLTIPPIERTIAQSGETLIPRLAPPDPPPPRG